MTVRDVVDADAPLIAHLVERYPFKPYRDYRVWSRSRQRTMLQGEVERALAAPAAVSLVGGRGEAPVVIIGRPLEWDSRFFGIPMARIEWVVRGPEATPADLTHGTHSMLDRLRDLGMRHVTARVDVADMDAVAALEACGFRLMDALVTYFTHPRGPAPMQVREVGRVRPLEPGDVDEVLAITADAYRGFRGRFHLDPHIPPERSQAFYVEWARQCCLGRMADRVVVADDGQGGLLGWASTRRVEPASALGGRVLWAGSLGACRREKPGAYAGLIRTLAAENHAAGDVTETHTQNHNIATVRIYDAVGARYVRSEYTFHAWLG